MTIKVTKYGDLLFRRELQTLKIVHMGKQETLTQLDMSCKQLASKDKTVTSSLSVLVDMR